MKITVLAFFFFLSTNISYSQIDNIRLLLGKSKAEVTFYLDSLNHLKSNVYYKIETNTDDAGNLILQSEYSINDQEFYKCFALSFVFRRLSGQEICVRQLFSGWIENVESNLNFIKDNFKYISSNKWEKPYGVSGEFKIVAEFTRKSVTEKASYIIDYYLDRVK